MGTPAYGEPVSTGDSLGLGTASHVGPCVGGALHLGGLRPADSWALPGARETPRLGSEHFMKLL